MTGVTTDALQSLLGQWLTGASPVTFYDAAAVIQPLERADYVPDELLRALIALHDLPCATPGARDVLASFLRTVAERQARERALVRRSLTIEDTGRTARLRRGQTLTIELAERTSLGLRWEIVEHSSRLALARGSDPLRPDQVCYSLQGKFPGQAHLVLAEHPTVARANADTRSFQLYVIVEDG